jgi:hypothetical protein
VIVKLLEVDGENWLQKDSATMDSWNECTIWELL